ncbi:MAG TPA: glycosyltransferase family 4 protein [Candidatus Saccharimonadales bacterium]
MKICHITKKYPNQLGGDVVVVSALQAYQEKAGHQLIVITSRSKEIKTGAAIYNVGLKDTGEGLDKITLKRLFSLCILSLRAFFIFIKERPAIVHTHSIDMAFAVAGAAHLLRVPLVHTFHIVTFYDKQQSVMRRWVELHLVRLARPTVITTPNRHDAAMLQQAGLKQAVYVPNGVDIDFWQPVADSSRNDSFTFISVGRLEPQKGYEYLIKAAALLKKSIHKSFQVIIVGEGAQRRQLQSLIRSLKATDVVQLVGRKTAVQTRRLLSAADVAVFASLYETTPLTLLEAWAMGLPVIMTPVGILHDAPLDTKKVFLVPKKDEQALMQAMRRSIENQAQCTTIAAAGQAEARQYSWLEVNCRYEKLYGSVL